MPDSEFEMVFFRIFILDLYNIIGGVSFFIGRFVLKKELYEDVSQNIAYRRPWKRQKSC